MRTPPSLFTLLAQSTRVPFVPYPTPLYDENGELIGAVNLMVDVSAHKRAEEVQALLIDELNHRVKNTLAVVQSLAHQTLRSTSSPNSFVSSFSDRLEALSRAHSLLSESTWRGSDLGVLMKKEVLLGDAGDPRAIFSGPPVHIARAQSANGNVCRWFAATLAEHSSQFTLMEARQVCVFDFKEELGGEGGIRTPGDLAAQRFSRPPRSTTLAPLRGYWNACNRTGGAEIARL